MSRLKVGWSRLGDYITALSVSISEQLCGPHLPLPQGATGEDGVDLQAFRPWKRRVTLKWRPLWPSQRSKCPWWGWRAHCCVSCGAEWSYSCGGGARCGLRTREWREGVLEGERGGWGRQLCWTDSLHRRRPLSERSYPPSNEAVPLLQATLQLIPSLLTWSITLQHDPQTGGWKQQEHGPTGPRQVGDTVTFRASCLQCSQGRQPNPDSVPVVRTSLTNYSSGWRWSPPGFNAGSHVEYLGYTSSIRVAAQVGDSSSNFRKPATHEKGRILLVVSQSNPYNSEILACAEVTIPCTAFSPAYCVHQTNINALYKCYFRHLQAFLSGCQVENFFRRVTQLGLILHLPCFLYICHLSTDNGILWEYIRRLRDVPIASDIWPALVASG